MTARPGPLSRVLVVGLKEDGEVLSLPSAVAAGVPGTALTRVETREAAEGALAAGHFDAVVIDCDLPGLHPSVLGPVLDRAAPAPVLLVSWGVGEVAAVGALRAGARDWVLKSELPRLGPALAQHLGRRAAPVDPFALVVDAVAQMAEGMARLKLGEGHELARQLRLMRAAVERARPPARRVRARARPGAPRGVQR